MGQGSGKIPWDPVALGDFVQHAGKADPQGKKGVDVQVAYSTLSPSGIDDAAVSGEKRSKTAGSSRGHSASCRRPVKTAPANAIQVFSPHCRQLERSSSLKTSMVFLIAAICAVSFPAPVPMAGPRRFFRCRPGGLQSLPIPATACQPVRKTPFRGRPPSVLPRPESRRPADRKFPGIDCARSPRCPGAIAWWAGR